MLEIWVPINSNPQRTRICNLHSFCFLSAPLPLPFAKVTEFRSKQITMLTDPNYPLPMSFIHQKNYNPLINTGFKGFHDLLNYIEDKGGVKSHMNRESHCILFLDMRGFARSVASLSHDPEQHCQSLLPSTNLYPPLLIPLFKFYLDLHPGGSFIK